MNLNNSVHKVAVYNWEFPRIILKALKCARMNFQKWGHLKAPISIITLTSTGCCDQKKKSKIKTWVCDEFNFLVQCSLCLKVRGGRGGRGWEGGGIIVTDLMFQMKVRYIYKARRYKKAVVTIIRKNPCNASCITIVIMISTDHPTGFNH